MSLESKYQKILAKGDIEINGTRAWDIKVNNPKLWRHVLLKGELGFGEAYMAGWFDVEHLDEFFYRLTRFVIREINMTNVSSMFLKFISNILNLQTTKRAFKVGKAHYNIGNNLYKKMLGTTMIYTCGYWKNANSLEESQEAKFHLIAKKLMLKPGMSVLDIGCGFGSMMAFLAKEYDVKVLGITVSKEQEYYINRNYKAPSVKVKVMDYRSIRGKFDRIYSLGMFEHVGYKNYKTYMKVCSKALKSDGLMLLHTIGDSVSNYNTNPWIEKYIFPNSMIPSLSQISKSAEGVFVIEDVQNFGYDYYKTLLAWYKNFNHNWQFLKAKYDDTFYRMWSYYLLSCAGAFRGRYLQLFQVVMSPNGIEGRYNATR